MKDGRAHLVSQAEDVVNLKSDLALAAEVQPADQTYGTSLVERAIAAKASLHQTGSDAANVSPSKVAPSQSPKHGFRGPGAPEL